MVDDAQWLDRASADALLFAARRLDSESIVLLLCARTGAFPAAGLPELTLKGLSAQAATELLRRRPARQPPVPGAGRGGREPARPA